MANFETRTLHTAASFRVSKVVRAMRDEYDLGETLGKSLILAYKYKKRGRHKKLCSYRRHLFFA